MSEHPRDRAPAPAHEPGRPEGEPLTCRELVASLDAFLARELPSERAERFERHLAGCSDCRAYRESYGSAIELGRAALLGGEPPPVPEELVDSILAALGEA